VTLLVSGRVERDDARIDIIHQHVEIRRAILVEFRPRRPALIPPGS
jgi:hypothetical protein